MKLNPSQMKLPIAAAFVVGLPAAASAQQETGWGHHMWNGGPWMFFGPFIWILVTAGVVIGFLYLILSRGGGPTTPVSPKTPHDILDERFARGEIDEKEYKDRKRALDS